MRWKQMPNGTITTIVKVEKTGLLCNSLDVSWKTSHNYELQKNQRNKS